MLYLKKKKKNESSTVKSPGGQNLTDLVDTSNDSTCDVGNLWLVFTSMTHWGTWIYIVVCLQGYNLTKCCVSWSTNLNLQTEEWIKHQLMYCQVQMNLHTELLWHMIASGFGQHLKVLTLTQVFLFHFAGRDFDCSLSSINQGFCFFIFLFLLVYFSLCPFHS